jgi:hypothetical protein
MYIHDTFETFAARMPELRTEWVENIRPVLHANSIRTIERAVVTLFGEVTDSIRGAVRIAEARHLTPEAIRETCITGLRQIVGRA